MILSILFAALVATSPTACDPPDAPPGWQSWPVVETTTLRLRADVGPPIAVDLVTHERRGRRVSAGWVRGRLVFFDDHPGELMMLYDARAVSRDVLRAAPASGCDWRRFR